MIRGTIEGVTRNAVFGWIWSAEGDLAGRTVLAFLDHECIGSGRVERHRKDLQDAGLGNGMAGFEFSVTYVNPADSPRVTVRLEGSDLQLLQPRARVMPPGSGATLRPGRVKPSMGSLQWMRARGWIGKADFDFLRFFRQVGVYERPLAVSPEPGAPLLDPAETARTLLQLERMDEGAMRRETLESPRDWRRLAEEQELTDGPGAVLAIWSTVHGPLPVLEGSHIKPPVVGVEDSPPAVTYNVGPNRLLFLDSRTMLSPEAAFPPGGVDAFFLAS
jgi:hypothetical protein